jgi:predicted peptidase
MKSILSIAGLLLIAYTVSAQYDPVDTTQIVVKTGATNNTPALIHLPNDYNSTSTSYPLIIFCHGLGEEGGPAQVLYSNQQSGGPCYYIAQGQWPSSFSNPIDGQSYKFIVVTPWYTSSAGPVTTGSLSPGMVDTILADLISRYRVDPSRIYLTGLSAGGQAVVNYAGNTNDADATPIPTRFKIAAAVPMSAQFNGGHQKSIADSAFAHKTGLWGFGSPSDTHGANTLGIIYFANQDSAGYAQSTSYTGGHCCWGQFYTPTFTQAWRGNTVNIYQFMLGYKAGQQASVLVANAGPDQNIQLPLDSAQLNGSGSGGGVTGYTWSFISGPSAATIDTTTTMTSWVKGLTASGTYSFQLTVRNATGLTASDTVLINVAAAATGLFDPVDTSQIVVKTGATNSTPALIHLPNDYNTSGKSYPLILFCHGSDQVGGPAAAFYNNQQSGGPAYYIGQGQWPSGINNPADGQSYKFIVVSPWYTSTAGPNTNNGSLTAGMVDSILADLINRYRVDPTRIYLTGLGAGGQAVVCYTGNTNDANNNPIPTRYKIAAAVPMSAQFNGGHQKSIADSAFAHKTGLWGIGDPTESWGANTLGIVYFANQDSAGYAQSTQFSGGHCCWGQYYTPTYTQSWRGNALNIYQFMLGYKVAPVVANAGPDQNIQLPLDSARLNGSASGGGVTGYNWSFIYGPVVPSITTVTTDSTWVKGLTVSGTYAFQLTVSNAAGATAKDTVLINVAAAISLYDPVDTAQILVKTGATNSTPALIHLPNDYNTSGKSYPLILFCHGSGQFGGPASALYNNQQSGGPAYYIGQGQWPSIINNPADGQSYKFIVVSPWYTSTAGPNTNNGSLTAGMVDSILADLVSRYRVDASRIYLTGLGAGGQAVVCYTGNTYDANNNPIPTRYKIAAAVPMSAQFNGGHQKSIADSAFAHKTGLWGIGDPTESWGANTLGIVYFANQDSAGYAQSTQFSGGQCCWGQYYTPTYTQSWRGNAVNIYQFMLGYKSALPLPVVANAGPDQNIQLPLDSVQLNGSASGSGVTSYNWSQISGPVVPSIDTATTVTTWVKGLTATGTYSFLLTVRNAAGSVAIDTVLINITAAPSCQGVRRNLNISANDQGKWITMQNTPMNPGDTLVVNSQYRWTYLSGDGIHGTQGCPIVIMNDTGQVEMTAGMAFSNSTYLHFTGTGSPNHFYGFYIHSYDSVVAYSRGNSLQFGDRSAFCEVDHVDEYLKTYAMWLKEEAMCPDSLIYPNWHLDNFSIHDIRARNINQDGFYLGSTSPNGERSITCNGVVGSPIPMRLSNIHIYNIILDSVGRSGIQLSGADSGVNEINNCRVTRTGYEYNQSQGSGIILGGYTHASVHDNYIRNTFQHGIFCIGAGLQNVYNNNIDSSGFLPNTTADTISRNPGYSSINGDTRLTTNQGATPGGINSTIWVKSNTVGQCTNQDPVTGTIYNIDIGQGYSSYPTWDSDNAICHNLMQNGTTRAIFRVNTNIVYDTACSGQSPLAVVPKNVSANPAAFDAKTGLGLTNYPNPFSTGTTISFTLLKPANVVLKVTNVTGSTMAVVVNGHLVAGTYNYNRAFSVSRLAPGVYILTLVVDGQPYSRLMLKQ